VAPCIASARDFSSIHNAAPNGSPPSATVATNKKGSVDTAPGGKKSSVSRYATGATPQV
jgi:hypothetical protein